MSKKLWLISRQQVQESVLAWTLEGWKRRTRSRDPSLRCVSPPLFLGLHWIATLRCHPPARSLAARQQVRTEKCQTRLISSLNIYMEEKQFRIHSRRRPDGLADKDAKVSTDTDACMNKTILIKSIIRTSTWGWGLFHGNYTAKNTALRHSCGSRWLELAWLSYNEYSQKKKKRGLIN